jgi:extradiol dioxygenase family protein
MKVMALTFYGCVVTLEGNLMAKNELGACSIQYYQIPYSKITEENNEARTLIIFSRSGSSILVFIKPLKLLSFTT